MIDKISYEDMISYSKELQASAEVIQSLMENKDLKELEKFVKEVKSYSEFLKTSVDMYKDADASIEFIKEQNRTSN